MIMHDVTKSSTRIRGAIVRGISGSASSYFTGRIYFAPSARLLKWKTAKRQKSERFGVASGCVCSALYGLSQRSIGRCCKPWP